MKTPRLGLALFAFALSALWGRAAGSLTVPPGTGVTITVTADGTTPFSYQWYKNGTAIVGAISAALTITSPTTGDSGSYTVLISNAAGSTTSDPATLIVIIPPSNAKTAIARTSTNLTAQR